MVAVKNLDNIDEIAGKTSGISRIAIGESISFTSQEGFCEEKSENYCKYNERFSMKKGIIYCRNDLGNECFIPQGNYLIEIP